MAEELTVQQVAERTGLSEHTLRYYERIGLIPPVGRASNGHRRYSQLDVDRIRFVRGLRSTGMPIAEAQRYTDLARQGKSTLSERLAILEAHRRRLREKVQEYGDLLQKLEYKTEHYRELEELCGVQPLASRQNVDA
jgi:DNA-binding transcriptional MerR regulator